jgi:hypothetical protein
MNRFRLARFLIVLATILYTQSAAAQSGLVGSSFGLLNIGSISINDAISLYVKESVVCNKGNVPDNYCNLYNSQYIDSFIRTVTKRDKVDHGGILGKASCITPAPPPEPCVSVVVVDKGNGLQCENLGHRDPLPKGMSRIYPKEGAVVDGSHIIDKEGCALPREGAR